MKLALVCSRFECVSPQNSLHILIFHILFISFPYSSSCSGPHWGFRRREVQPLVAIYP